MTKAIQKLTQSKSV